MSKTYLLTILFIFDYLLVLCLQCVAKPMPEKGTNLGYLEEEAVTSAAIAEY